MSDHSHVYNKTKLKKSVIRNRLINQENPIMNDQPMISEQIQKILKRECILDRSEPQKYIFNTHYV